MLLKFAVIVNDESEDVLPVAMVKFADVWPAATVTLVGTVALAASSLVSFTSAPPAGATAFSVTVAVTGLPAVTVAGLSVSLPTDVAEAVELPPPVLVPEPLPEPVVPAAGDPENPLAALAPPPQPVNIDATSAMAASSANSFKPV